jgi:hypothetical protein
MRAISSRIVPIEDRMSDRDPTGLFFEARIGVTMLIESCTAAAISLLLSIGSYRAVITQVKFQT